MSLVIPQGKNRKFKKTAQLETNAGRLEEIKEEMLSLLDEAEHLVRQERGVYDRAKSYWIPHIKMALTKEHEYLGGSMVTMEDTIEELKEQLEE